MTHYLLMFFGARPGRTEHETAVFKVLRSSARLHAEVHPHLKYANGAIMDGLWENSETIGVLIDELRLYSMVGGAAFTELGVAKAKLDEFQSAICERYELEERLRLLAEIWDCCVRAVRLRECGK